MFFLMKKAWHHVFLLRLQYGKAAPLVDSGPRNTLFPFLLGGLLVVAAIWPRSAPEPLTGIALTGRILEIIDAKYVEEVDQDELLTNGMNRMLSELDRNSVYYPPRRAEEFQNEMNGTLFGIGVILQVSDEAPRITHVLAGGPADQSGIPADARLISIDGETCEDWPLSKISSSIKGERGTSVTLVVEAAGTTSTHTPIRDEVSIPSLTLLERIESSDPSSWGLVRLQQFQPGTTEELRIALKAEGQPPLAGLVIDLRNNPGGVLEEAVSFCSLFLEEGQEIVSTRNLRDEIDDSFTQVAEETGDWLDLPLVILIDGNSASASETVSAALRDHGRAVLVGEPSFGKWTVQGVYHLDNSETPALLKLTTDFFFPPTGQRLSYDDRGLPDGLVPDVEVSTGDDKKRALYDFWSERFYSELSKPERGWTRSTRAEAIMLPGEETDEALETALELLEDQDRYQQLLEAPTLNPRSPR